jgi:tRNA-splicing ligase RtcB
MKIKKISENIYEIEKFGKMNVPVRIFSSEKVLEKMKEDKTLEQAKNVSELPGIIKYSIALPDSHQGYGFPIGGVAAFDLEKGVISPGGVGYDINCGVRLLKTNLTKKNLEKKEKIILDLIYKNIPSGVGVGSSFKVKLNELKEVLKKGAKYIIEKGYGEKDDYLYLEEEGCIENSNPEKVSDKAIKRGIGQLGTLGAGNHFLEIQEVDEIFDDKTAKVFGLKKGQITILIHCGSRGLGHQVASDYIKEMEKEYGFKNLSDRELINAPLKSKLGQNYISAMNCAANFAFANRQLITHGVRETFRKIFPDVKIEIVYDVCHNIAKIEEYVVDGKKIKLCVHRKGATRSFGSDRKEIPEKYRKVGQPVLIPGSMGTSSYVLVGTKKAEETTFGSTAHGAGRAKSRTSAIKEFRGEKIKEELNAKKIEIKAGNWKSLAEEAPEAYKDIDEIVRIVDEEGLSKKVAKLKPLIVIKG